VTNWCDMRIPKLGGNGPKRISEQIKSSTRSRRGSIHRSSSSSPREWLLKSKGKISSDLPSLIYPLFSPLSPLQSLLSPRQRRRPWSRRSQRTGERTPTITEVIYIRPQQSLDQALDPHLSQVGLDSRSHYHSHYPGPHIITSDHAGAPHHTDHMSFYSAPHEMPVQTPTASSSKRKQLESQYTQGAGKKRRSDVYEDEADDPEVGEDGGASGARHWTDEEKTKLFNWLMGPNEDEHFDALRTKKNTCFRDVGRHAERSMPFTSSHVVCHSVHWMHSGVAKPS